MKNILFGALFVVSTILTSCGSSTTPAVEEVKPTEDSTKTEAVSVTTPSVDSAKVEKKTEK